MPWKKFYVQTIFLVSIFDYNKLEAISLLGTCRPPPPSKVVASKTGYDGCGVCWIEREKEWKNSPIFIFRIIIENWGDFCQKNDTKMTITRKIKIEKLIFLSIHNIPHISCKFDHFWKKKIIYIDAVLCVPIKLKWFFWNAADVHLFRIWFTNPNKKF